MSDVAAILEESNCSCLFLVSFSLSSFFFAVDRSQIFLQFVCGRPVFDTSNIIEHENIDAGEYDEVNT